MERFLRYFFTAGGLVATVMRLLKPQWTVFLHNSGDLPIDSWLWSPPAHAGHVMGTAMVDRVSVDWSTTIAMAAGTAVATVLWWALMGVYLRRQSRATRESRHAVVQV